MEIKRQRVYRQTATVKKIEERHRTKYLRGTGKEAETEEVSDGWWITFNENLTAVRCEIKPDCQVGDHAVCTWEFHKP